MFYYFELIPNSPNFVSLCQEITPDVLHGQAVTYVTAIQWNLLYYYEGGRHDQADAGRIGSRGAVNGL
jgi:hypothetical protein